MLIFSIKLPFYKKVGQRKVAEKTWVVLTGFTGFT
jgi:hypothetical protein